MIRHDLDGILYHLFKLARNGYVVFGKRQEKRIRGSFMQEGRNVGICLMNDFVLDKAVLSEEEKKEMLTALKSISNMQNISSSQILQKLSAIFNLSSRVGLK